MIISEVSVQWTGHLDVQELRALHGVEGSNKLDVAFNPIEHTDLRGIASARIVELEDHLRSCHQRIELRWQPCRPDGAQDHARRRRWPPRGKQNHGRSDARRLPGRR